MESKSKKQKTADATPALASMESQSQSAKSVSSSATSRSNSNNAPASNAPAEQSSAGNFLRNDQSLIMKSVRSDRFTEKFRDGVVQRILEGRTTIAEVRDKHYLTEQDVIAWIKASFDRKQKRIDELNMQIQFAHADTHKGNDGILKIENEPRRVSVKAEVIDVQSRNRSH